MPSKRALHIMIVIIFAFVAATMQAQQTNAGEPATAVGQQVQTPQRLQYPPLFFREDWALASGLPNANTPQEPEHGVVQTDLTNPNLEVHLWGDKVGPVTVKQTYNDDITYVMTLLCTSNCAITLRDKNNDVNLTGLATIRWRTKVTGFHLLHPIIKLADGTWLVGDHAAGFSTDWVESQIQVADVRWRKLDIQDVVEGRGDPWVEKPDLSRVEEIGFTEMMRGGGHGGAGSRIDWIEVYGKPVPRAPSTTSRNR
ncbi:MAG TPA: hypothetical protein VFB23_10140 [Candidatus Acidoferrales bacterium]|nr:hypothetical protein [Candidatus Acidoferrales bacterium]